MCQTGLEPIARSSEAPRAQNLNVPLRAQYLTVRQGKLGTIIIQTVHILQHDSAVTADGELLHEHWKTQQTSMKAAKIHIKNPLQQGPFQF